MTDHVTEALAALCILAALVLAIAAFGTRRDHKKQSYHPWPPSRPKRTHSQPAPFVSSSSRPDLTDVGVQLNAIMKAAFQKRRVMNRSEYEVFKIVESEVAAAKKGHRVFAQTSLGQVLESPSSDVFRSINAKRVDILVVDRGEWPAFAVEYRGPGHYQGTAAARDAIKKEALRRAGVGYLEVTPGDDEAQLRLRIREHLGVKSSDSNATIVDAFTVVPQLH